jgi:hypothetical protein
MAWFLVMQVSSMLIELIQLGRTSEREKDLEILLLRQQLLIAYLRFFTLHVFHYYPN